ncbi:MAG: PQQ-binding-like beta-propeller repeat protein [Saprospiraceae bacterium]|nr:PQQ-binding-like beta-propeller repeat protein [Saprospiraceae bacterium]
MRTILFLLGMSALLCCGKKQVEKPVLIWRSSPFGKVQIETIYPIFHDNKIMVTHSTEHAPFTICALSTKDGHIIWQYQDTAVNPNVLYYNLRAYQDGSTLLIPMGNRLMAFDMQNGKKLWENTMHDAAEDFIEGIGSLAFRIYYDLVEPKAYLYCIDTKRGDASLFQVFEIEQGHKAFYRTPRPLIGQRGDTCLVFTSIFQNLQSKETFAGLNWMDYQSKSITQRDTIYPINYQGEGVTKQPLLDPAGKQLYFVANNELVCYHAWTRKELWRTEMPRDMLTSFPVADRKRVYFACEDGKVYAVDKNNGNILWSTHVSGTPSRIYDDGQSLHVIGGSDGIWHILDKDTGIETFQTESPNRVNYPSIFFRRAFSVCPDKNAAICTDGKDFFYYQW